MYIKQLIKTTDILFAADFSSRFVSLLIIKDGKSKSYKTEIGGKFSIYLLDYFIEVLKNEGIKITRINKFIVSTGPGRLTAIRVGLSLIKAMAINKPIIGISTLPLICSRIKMNEGESCYPFVQLSSKLFCVAGFVLKDAKLEYLEEQRVVDYSEIKDMIDSGKRVVGGNSSDLIDHSTERCYTDWNRMLEISGDLWDEFNDETLEPNYIVKPRVIIKNDCKTV